MSDITLKEYIDTKLADLDKRIYESQKAQNATLVAVKSELESKTELALHSQERAVSIANAELIRRLDSMNEFRGQLKDQAGTFVSRDAYETQNLRHEDEHKLLNDRLSAGLSVDVYRIEHGALVKRVDELSQWKAEREATIVQIGNLTEKIAILEAWRAGREGLQQKVADVEGKVEKLDTWKATKDGEESKANRLSMYSIIISIVVLAVTLVINFSVIRQSTVPVVQQTTTQPKK
jgi:hypothetical protein